ncbi:methyltransferase domain-containing protein [Paraflavitalea speifideaquila]|uniref:methyltransferase domain-containing protein n=1 Tax=Paraflavitalea speifideaquila TaxID=3076558 RepID=UPI0028F14E4E|nr:methyltransferase domain-containing protein [Paraflavitalea speifideiaquila]
MRFTQDIPSEGAIGKYYQSENYISHTNTNKGLVNRLYHIVRNHTLNKKKKLVQSFTQRSTGSLLEVGAGVGAFAAFMRQAGWEVMGLEPDAETRKRALEQNRIGLQDTGIFSSCRQEPMMLLRCGMYWSMCIVCMNTWIN